jgi:hypothetical protein
MSKQLRPPYTSGSDIEAFFARIKTLQAPAKIDSEWVKTYKLAPNQPEAMPSLLKWLGVTDANSAAVASIWDGIRLPQSRADALEPLVRSAYAEVFGRLDVEHASLDDLASTFVVAYGMGDPGRQVRCFLVLCGLAAIPTDAGETPQLEPEQSVRRRSSAPRKGPKPPQKPGTATEHATDEQSQHATPVVLSLSVELPADWSERQIRQRIVDVSRILSEVGLGAA